MNALNNFKRFLALLQGVLILGHAYAQDLTISSGGSEVGLRHVEVDQNFSYVVQFPTGTTSVVCCEGVACIPAMSPPFSFGGARATFSSATRQLTVAPATNPPNTIENEYTLRLQGRNSGGTPTTGVAQVSFVIRQPANFVFVLDRSGSMECRPDQVMSDWPACSSTGPNDRRWDKLKESVFAFVDKFNNLNHNISNDRMAVVYFEGITTSPGTLPGLNTVPNFHTNIQANLNSQEGPLPDELGRTGTSIGAGMLEAIQSRLTTPLPANRRNVVILFTDGEQNANPSVVAVPDRRITGLSGGAADVLVNPLIASGLQIYTIGFVNTSPALSTLEQLSSNPATNYFNTATWGTNYDQDIAGSAFNEIFNKHSPQAVRLKDTLTLAGGVSETFQCNKNATHVFVEAFFERPIAQFFNFSVEKDGANVTQRATNLRRGVYSVTFSFDLLKLQDIGSGGVWKLTCTPATGVPIEDIVGQKVRLSAALDDHSVKFGYSPGSGRIYAGEPMEHTVTLTVNGQPVTGAFVTAEIRKPGDDVGDLLGRTNLTVPPLGHKELGSCAERKYAAIAAQNPSLLDALKQVQTTKIILTHQGNGVYKGIYNDADVTGIYKVLYTAVDTSTGIGIVSRAAEKTVYVRFKEAEVRLVPGKLNTGFDSPVYYHTLHIVPAYQVGGKTRLVGPGYTRSFWRLEGAGAKLTTVEDNCDGSYDLHISGISNPTVRIFLDGEKVYSGDLLYIFNPRSPFGVSVHAGIAALADGLKFSDEGSFVEADVSYRFNKWFSLEAVGGRYSFKNNSKIVGGALYAKLHLSLDSADEWQLTFAGGGGAYKPDGVATAFGYTGRVGVEKSLSTHLSAAFEAGYFGLPKPDISFGIAGLGLKYRF